MAEMASAFPDLSVAYPDWMAEVCRPGAVFPSLEDRMGLVIELARTNVSRQTGGPFAAAIFDAATGEVLAPGVNLVVSSHAAVAHAEMLAIAVAGRVLGSFDLGTRATELFASAEPCAMCLGAIPWSGVRLLVCGARDEDARRIGFDEGDKPSDWVGRLRTRGIDVIQDVSRTEATAVLEEYARAGGTIYNGRAE
jgi:tRNA(Arg) A34 adenosine deaminase TadA